MKESKFLYYELTPRYDTRQSFYRKAYVEETNENEKILYSYCVPVAMIEDNKLFINDNERWYSQTTLRHIKEFARQELDLILTKNECKKYLVSRFENQLRR